MEQISMAAHLAQVNRLRTIYSELSAEMRDQIWDLEEKIENRDKLIGYLQRKVEEKR